MKVVVPLSVLLLLAGLGLVVAGRISPVSALASGIAFEPPAPNSSDRIAARVSGFSPGFCDTPSLALLPLEDGTLRIDLDLGRCQPGQSPSASGPYDAETTLGPLPPGSYTVQVFADGVLQETADLQVHRAETVAGLPARSGLGMLAVVLLLALAGAALLR